MNKLEQKICLKHVLCQGCPFKLQYTNNQSTIDKGCFNGYVRSQHRYRRKKVIKK